MRKVKLGQHTVDITNEEKELFPKAHITKGELINYYMRIAPTMIPYIKNRPVTMQRFPQGIKDEGFYQKDASAYFPSWIKRKPIARKKDGMVNYVVCNNVATLVYLANQLCITPHIWLSKTDKLNYPDRMIFDLDPSPDVSFATIRWAAKKIKALLERLELKAFVMTTGSRGVHIIVPLKRVHTFDQVRTFAHDIAALLADTYPKKLTIEMRKAKRGKRVFIDFLRNSFGATGVAPYAVRAKPGAPIAMPIDWQELDNVTSQKFTVKNIFRRLARKKDQWQGIDASATSLKKARKLLDALLARLGNAQVK